MRVGEWHRAFRLVGTAGFAVVVGAAIYGSFEEIGFDPAFPRHGDLADFGSFYEAGGAATRGDNPYDIYPLTYFAGNASAGAATNLNAPFSVLLFEPLTLTDPASAARLWNIAAFIAFGAAVLLLLSACVDTRAPWRLVWAFGISALWGTLGLGQIYTFLALLATGAWLLLTRGRDREAGVLIGLIAAIKPNFLVWPVLLFVAGRRRPALFSVFATAALSLLPLLQLGPRVYAEWLAVVRDNAVSAEATNGALSGLAARLGLPTPVGIAGAAAVLLGLAWWTWRVRPSPARASGAALAGTLLASPLAWTGYSVLLVPIFFARKWNFPMGFAAVLLLIPVGSVLLPLSSSSPVAHVTIGSTYTLIWLLVLLAVLRPQPKSGVRPAGNPAAVAP